MTVGQEGDADLLRHFSGDPGAGIGRFEADPVTGSWWWSDAVYRIFGIQEGTVEPTWELVREHIPEQERATIDVLYTAAGQQNGPFSWSHSLRAADGILRSVLVIGVSSPRARPAFDGRLARPLAGYLSDLTALRLHAARAAATDAVQRSAAHRAVIEQAKGALMLAYHLDAQAAFDLLTWHSQHTNRKLHTIAATVVASLTSNGRPATDLTRDLDATLAGVPARTSTRAVGCSSSQ